MIVTVEFEIFNLLSTNLISEPDAEASPQFPFGICVVVMAGLLRVFGLTETIESDAEASPQFLYGICVVAMAGLSRTQLFSFILRFLNLLFNVVNGKIKLWHDFVPSSLVFHNKMLLQERYERIESEAEASPQFLYGYASPRWLDCRGFKCFCNYL